MKGSIAVATAAVVVGVGVAPPVGAWPDRTGPAHSAVAVELAASSTALRPQPRTVETQQALATVADQIDNTFIDLTMVIRRGVTPVLNALGYLGKQLYIGLNLIESVSASAVFNSTDVLRGEGVLRNLGEFALDVGVSALYVVVDESSLRGGGEAFVLPRPPLDRPLRWDDAQSPSKGLPLTVPDRDAPEVTAVGDDDETAVRDDKPAVRVRDSLGKRPLRESIRNVVEQRKGKKAENAEKREQRREAREARKAQSARGTDAA